MNNIIKSLKERKSVRIFADKDIDDEIKDSIIEAAFEAPTAGNMQMYSIINITNQDLLEKLAKSCDDQPFIAKAKLALIFVADYQKWYDAFQLIADDVRKPNVGELLLGVNDALIAAQNTVVAAESHGIGSCYIGDIMEKHDYHKELLNLPHYAFPVTMLVFGYPVDQQKARLKPKRFPREYIVNDNEYRTLDKSKLKQMFEDRAAVSQSQFNFESFLLAFYKRKYDTDFSVEMSASIRKYIDDFEE